MFQRERFQEDIGLKNEESAIDPVIWSRNGAHDTAFWVLAGFMVFALDSRLSNCHLFQLSAKLLLKWDQIRSHQKTGAKLFALFARFPERSSHVLHFIIVCLAGILLLVLDDGIAILSGELLHSSALRPEKTVYFMARLRMKYLQSGMKRRCIERRAEDVTEDKQVATAVEKKVSSSLHKKLLHHLIPLPLSPRKYSLKP